MPSLGHSMSLILCARGVFIFSLDEYANVLTSAPSQKDHPEDYIPELHDIPISVVNAMLYQDEMEDGLSDQAFVEAHSVNQQPHHDTEEWPLFANFSLSS
jgi:hypothetical protein